VSVVYLAALSVSIFGMVMLDRRFRLFFWDDARRATVVLVAGVALFLAWDLLGIGLGIFFRGQTPFMTGVLLAPELPLEEVFFLTLLCYLSMNAFGAAMRLGPSLQPVDRHHPVPEPVEGTLPAGRSRPVPEPVEGKHLDDVARPERHGEEPR
jgi:lycopene cyclase domain-containing protein